MNDYGGDLSKRWYIVFYALNPDTGKLEMGKRQWCPAKLKTVTARRNWGKLRCQQINHLLTGGYVFDFTPAKPANPDPVTTSLVNNQLSKPATLLDAMERFVTLRERTHRNRTHQTNAGTVARWKQFCAHLKETMGLDLSLKALEPPTTAEINAFSDYIIQARACSNRTRNNLIADLRTLTNGLAERGWLPENCFPKWTRLVEDPSRIHDVYTPEQQRTLTEWLQANDHRLYFLTQFVYYGFLRPIELTRLRVRDVDLANNQIKIHRSDAKGGRKSVGYEVIVINHQLQVAIDKMQLHLAQPNDYVFGKDLLTCDVSILRNRVSERHAKALKGAELYNGELTLYGWKHTGVCNAYRAGADIMWIQKQLRHASLDDTQIYLRSLGLTPPERIRVEW
ncbi:tyrosine-type recombinase/integrase [Fibrella forsythiae]|uniref:Tyrosine-type recombinase/integrase n=1 Tax=Fibrella forsythiae TaxID=2817061 RepID=A0ABS3JP03_9BACT|nr:site-specific integrase [Fibrella forsythiae]MBO0951223.1 tyrosine-type recombinase/integrase [Fibrella forsythiae]